jgi:hypothetical protein
MKYQDEIGVEWDQAAERAQPPGRFRVITTLRFYDNPAIFESDTHIP